MLDLGAAYGILDDAEWCRLIGDEAWYVWGEAVVRDVDADVKTFARDVIARHRSSRLLPLTQQNRALPPALYRTVVLNTRYIRSLDSSGSVGGRANVVLSSAVPGRELPPFHVAPSVERIGFAPNSEVTSIGDDFFRGFVPIRSVNLGGLPNVTRIGHGFLLLLQLDDGSTFPRCRRSIPSCPGRGGCEGPQLAKDRSQTGTGRVRRWWIADIV